MEWFGLEGTLRVLPFHFPAMDSETSTRPDCSKPEAEEVYGPELNLTAMKTHI